MAAADDDDGAGGEDERQHDQAPCVERGHRYRHRIARVAEAVAVLLVGAVVLDAVAAEIIDLITASCKYGPVSREAIFACLGA